MMINSWRQWTSSIDSAVLTVKLNWAIFVILLASITIGGDNKRWVHQTALASVNTLGHRQNKDAGVLCVDPMIPTIYGRCHIVLDLFKSPTLLLSICQLTEYSMLDFVSM
eukprot:4660172-Amphidinium_carterae.2